MTSPQSQVGGASVGIGVGIGAGLGLVVALVVGAEIGLGLAFGAAVGVVGSLLIEAGFARRRSRHMSNAPADAALCDSTRRVFLLGALAAARCFGARFVTAPGNTSRSGGPTR